MGIHLLQADVQIIDVSWLGCMRWKRKLKGRKRNLERDEFEEAYFPL